ncbi:hypothetical protein ACFZDG_01480 [Kitasatospora xanthocidica]|uniref:hypothetical protein n=1 Tax=Kitasatospora xanthocidica TaxID=83382 RepID=UPI0036EA48CA
MAGAEQIRGLVVTGHEAAQMADEEVGVDRRVEPLPANGRLDRSVASLWGGRCFLLPFPKSQPEHVTRDVQPVRDALDDIDLLDLGLARHDFADAARGHVTGARDGEG